jgi:prevent-host-death family protein
MKTIGAFSAKTHLSDLLDQVARGKSFVITKRGRPMAALSPINLPRRQGPRDSIYEFRKQFSKSLKKFSPREIKELKELGQR